MPIKHLVISGGGPTLVQALGAIQHVEEKKFIDLSNIETIYGTSAGAILGTLICLKFDWETINDYIIKRPWHEVFPINVQKIFDAYTKKGIFDCKTVEKIFKPLFSAKDLALDINLHDFYNYSKIELHFFTFDINDFKIEDISYKTHPNISVIMALQMTCSLPVLVAPVCIENKCYIDGGIVCNYPLNKCLELYNEDEILGIKNQYDKNDSNRVDSQSTMLDFLMSFVFKMIQNMDTGDKQTVIKNEIICKADFLSIDYLKTALYSMDVRKELFDSGVEFAKDFLSLKHL
uniref:PNPLA domain-containing protein n=1 Tax=viral metagenome TaxID=1070528 RepID=A0A6C0IFE4_9ZZZZ